MREVFFKSIETEMLSYLVTLSCNATPVNCFVCLFFSDNRNLYKEVGFTPNS